jgi:hypothetical protein
MPKEKVLIRSFNAFIDSKSGLPLPLGKRRLGFEPWMQFENSVQSELKSLGFDNCIQIDHPRQKDAFGHYALNIYCHRNRIDMPDAPQASLFYMQMHKKTLFTLNRSGWGWNHDQKNNLIEKARLASREESESFFKTFIEKLVQNQDTKISFSGQNEFSQFENEKLPDQYLFVPLQVTRDYVIKNLSPIGVPEFLEKICLWAKSKSIPLVIKPHPFNRGDLEIFETLKQFVDQKNIFVSQRPIFDLIAKAQSVWLINSGVGFESMYFLKPVVTLGKCDYEDCTILAKIDRLDSAYQSTLAFGEIEKELYRKFLFVYFNDHAFDLSLDHSSRLRALLKRSLEI